MDWNWIKIESGVYRATDRDGIDWQVELFPRPGDQQWSQVRGEWCVLRDYTHIECWPRMRDAKDAAERLFEDVAK